MQIYWEAKKLHETIIAVVDLVIILYALSFANNITQAFAIMIIEIDRVTNISDLVVRLLFRAHSLSKQMSLIQEQIKIGIMLQ